MRILFLSQLVPYPADAGPKVRSLHVLQYLVSAGHDVTLVAFQRPNDTPESLAYLKSLCSDVHTVMMHRSKVKDAYFFAKSLISNEPFLIARDLVPEMEQLIKGLAMQSQFDAVHADQLWMAPYALKIKDYVLNPPKFVLDQHNAVYLVPERMAGNTSNPLKKWVLGLEGKKMAKYEIDTCIDFDDVVWVTNEDRQALKAVANGTADMITGPTIPICVDPTVKQSIDRKRNGRRVTFLGGLHWPPNAEGMVWFYESVWPKILQEAPDALLTVIGKNPPVELAEDDGKTNLEVTGYVDDPVPFLEETAVFIVPLHSGGGMRVKIIDGWSWGLPIVSTTVGAEGVGYSDQKDIYIADTASDFAERIVDLLNNPEKAAILAQEGRTTVETRFDWHKTYKAWDAIYG
ncbi:MAG: glycosyltransferase family 4 protein [Chloroflexota bacterium]